jgi:intracellular sulfur oxidation DsrE/DsrF family protein
MMDQKQISDEMLSAHVDGQLSDEDSDIVLRQAMEDATVARRLDEIRRLKDMLRHAYQSPPTPWRGQRRDGSDRLRPVRIAVVMALIAIASVASWYAGQRFGANAVIDDYVVRSDWVQPANATAADRERVILHLSSKDMAQMQRSLDQAELILAGFEYNADAPAVELIANGDGLELFRRDVTPFADRIEALRRSYPSLGLFACARAIERLSLQGINVSMLPGVDTGSVAIERIYTRMRQGWNYEEI